MLAPVNLQRETTTKGTGTFVVVLATAELLESGRPATGGQVDVHGIDKRHALPH